MTLIMTGHTCTSGDEECLGCGAEDCPFGEPLHWHHDGCPTCDADPRAIEVLKLAWFTGVDLTPQWVQVLSSVDAGILIQSDV